MMYAGPLVALPDGRLVRKPFDDLKPNDMVVMGSGGAFEAEAAAMQAEFEAEIAAAGGLEAWKKLEPQHA